MTILTSCRWEGTHPYVASNPKYYPWFKMDEMPTNVQSWVWTDAVACCYSGKKLWSVVLSLSSWAGSSRGIYLGGWLIPRSSKSSSPRWN
ncbi:hypothetical protein CJ030_MR2G016854 [Morella rubra]|uniref:Uncharacterized protein n=1 Tax=Morella rubra TaxID=262757 RepID=A0A6A1WGI6_9ROSI|nr:hypothetical protein CJ030_MR2G016854 [Morella rubra]